MKYADHNRSGFTLLEMVIATAIFLLVFSTVFTAYNQGRIQSEMMIAETEIFLSGERAMDLMVSELKVATRTSTTTFCVPPPLPAAPVTVPGPPFPRAVVATAPPQITFFKPGDGDGNNVIIDSAGATEWVCDSVAFVFDAASGQLRRLVAGALDRVIVDNVTAVTFDDITTDASLALDEVRISLSLQETISLGRTVGTSIASTVKLRN